MAISLAGYHFQGSNGTNNEKGNLLVFPREYSGAVNIPPLELSYPKFQSGKKCYIGYGTDYTTGEQSLTSAIEKYFGPYYFGFGFVELQKSDDWKNSLSSILLADGTTSTEFEDCAGAHAYMIFTVIGEPSAGAGWFTELPENGFCGNFNQGYAQWGSIELDRLFLDYVIKNAKGKGGGQYKFNGRYVSTGNGKGKDMFNLKEFTGAKSWATGWLYPGDSAFGYIRGQTSNAFPSVIKNPFTNYSQSGMTVNPDLKMWEGSCVDPSITTALMIGGSKATAVTCTFNNVSWGSSRSYIYQSSLLSRENSPFQLRGFFPGYDYPPYGEPEWYLPHYSWGLIFTSEEVVLDE